MVELLDKYGGWPVVNGKHWNADEWNWLNISQQISNDGFIDLILDCHIEVEPKNSSKRVLIVNRAEFGLTRRALVKGMEYASVKDYYEFMVNVAVIFGANKSNAEIEMYDALQFEIGLSQVQCIEIELTNFFSILFVCSIRMKLFMKFPDGSD